MAQAHEVKQYKLAYTMRGPTEDSGGMFVAEIPAMPGCMVWGKTHEEALYILEGVAADFIQSYSEHYGEVEVKELVRAALAAGAYTDCRAAYNAISAVLRRRKEFRRVSPGRFVLLDANREGTIVSKPIPQSNLEV